MAVTVFQKGAVRINDETAIGVGPDEGIDKLIKGGYSRIEFLCNARREELGPLRMIRVKAAKDRGAVVFGVVWADSFANPDECFDFILSQRELSIGVGAGFTGFGINAEDGIEGRDQAGEKWSQRLCNRFRSHPLTRKLWLFVDTYIGCGGIDWRAWEEAKARLVVQTHHEAEGQWEWSVESYLNWAKQYGWLNPLPVLKPEFCCFKNNAGNLPSPDMQNAMIASAKNTGTKGMVMYYGEGAGDPNEYLIPFFNKAKTAGVCY